MRKHLKTKTTKEFERKELLKLEGQEIFGVAKFTSGKTYRGNITLRLLTEIKIYRPDGSVLEINHLYIPLEDTKHNDILWDNHLGGYRKFRAKVTSYGFAEKRASLHLNVYTNVYKFKR